MTARTFASLVHRIQPSVPGCPHPTIVQHIRDAAIRACERSLAWRFSQPRFALTPGMPEYFYTKPPMSEVHAVLMATVNDRPLTPMTLEGAAERFPQWADAYGGMSPEELWGEAEGTYNGAPFNENEFNYGSGPVTVPATAFEGASEPRFLTQVTQDKFLVLPAPDDTKSYLVRMVYALKPTRNATGFDEVAFNELEDVIFHGALQHLLTIPKVNWSDRELASYHAKQFVAQLAERRARANLGNQRGTVSVRMVPFG